MKTKTLMIDYRDSDANVVRREIDNMEFCVRDGYAYFASEGDKYQIMLGDVIQIYTY